MFEALRDRLHRDDRGFTLIELMVVVLIIAILIAIAVPTFLGARQRAQDRAAQSDLRNSLVTAKTFYTDDESYAATIADLDAIEPNLNFVAMIDADLSSEVGFTGTADEIVFVRVSESGTWFCIAENETAGTTYDSDALAVTPGKANVDTVAECDGASW